MQYLSEKVLELQQYGWDWAQLLKCYLVNKKIMSTELRNFLHRLDEDILAQFLSLAIVAEPAERNRHDMPFESLKQVAKGLAVAALCGPNQAEQLGVIGIQGKSGHGVLQTLHLKMGKQTPWAKQPGAGDRGKQGNSE